VTLATHEIGHQVLFNMTGTVEGGAYPDIEEGVADAITAMVHGPHSRANDGESQPEAASRLVALVCARCPRLGTAGR
jgi:hypothetical protein